VGDVARELEGGREGFSEHMGLPSERVLTMKLQVRRFVDCYERPLRDPKMVLVGLDHVEWGEAMAPLVFHEVAVGTVQEPCEGPERKTTALPGFS
jgi:hypothetical protein